MQSLAYNVGRSGTLSLRTFLATPFLLPDCNLSLSCIQVLRPSRFTASASRFDSRYSSIKTVAWSNRQVKDDSGSQPLAVSSQKNKGMEESTDKAPQPPVLFHAPLLAESYNSLVTPLGHSGNSTSQAVPFIEV